MLVLEVREPHQLDRQRLAIGVAEDDGEPTVLAVPEKMIHLTTQQQQQQPKGSVGFGMCASWTGPRGTRAESPGSSCWFPGFVGCAREGAAHFTPHRFASNPAPVQVALLKVEPFLSGLGGTSARELHHRRE